MQDVNDDMDDLYRKAADQYPLKTDGADWQKVFAGLQDAFMPVVEEKEKRKRRALWLWLLLPLGLLGTMYYKSDNQTTQQVAVTKEAANSRSGNEIVKNKINNNNSQKLDSELDKKLSSAAESTDSSTPVSSYVKAKNTDHSTLSSSYIEANEHLKTSHKSGTNISSRDKNIISTNTENELNTRATQSAFLKEKKQNSDDSLAIEKKNNIEANNKKKNLPVLQPNAAFNRIDKQDAQAANTVETITSRALQNEKMEATQDKKDSVALNNTKADSAATNNTSNENKSKMVKAKPRKQTGFYAGFLASFDVSTIKLQRINKAGHGFELLLGYRFSKRLSVESGVNWTDKKYYSTGKYFDKTNTGIPEASKIIYTNGTCTMFEIPAIVKYDFAQRKKSNWFATAGLSSYLMKDEKYSYYANHSGNYYNATKKYSHSGNNLFSVASLSIGYQLQVNKKISLRAEPYIKMPLSGIGIAKMPITSTGIAVGFTRSF